MKTRIPTQKLILTAMFTALTCVGAFIKIPMLWSSFTLQIFFVFMAGVCLGPWYAMLSQIAYVLLGLIGLPIFTSGGGFSYIFQPTFGFLLSYIPAAWVVGKMTEKNWKVSHVVLSCIVGLAVIYAIGIPYMALILNVYLGQGMTVWGILWAGMIPFLPYDALKIAATAILSKPLVPALKKIEAGYSRRSRPRENTESTKE